MASIKLTGDTSGEITISAPAVAGTNTLTLPAKTGTIGLYAAPQVTVLTSGTGTYTTPTGAAYLIIEMVGGGSGGGGAGGNGSDFNSRKGADGGSTTFGTSLLTCTGGTNTGGTGVGGSATVNSPAIAIVAINGGSGLAWQYNWGTSRPMNAVIGGGNPFGCGASATAVYGCGGVGAQLSNTGYTFGGNGGGSGGYIKAIITSPSSSYSYAIGAGGAGGTEAAAGAGGNGTAGQSGVIIVTAYFG